MPWDYMAMQGTLPNNRSRIIVQVLSVPPLAKVVLMVPRMLITPAQFQNQDLPS